MDLELVDTDDMIDELHKRFDHSVFVGMKDTSDTAAVTKRRWKGEAHTLAGLCYDVSMCILQDFFNRTDWNPEHGT